MNDTAIVECYSGYTYAQEPRAFVFSHKRRTIKAVLKMWRAPTGPCFEVLTEDGAVYLLAYNEAADLWHVSMLWEPSHHGKLSNGKEQN